MYRVLGTGLGAQHGRAGHRGRVRSFLFRKHTQYSKGGKEHGSLGRMAKQPLRERWVQEGVLGTEDGERRRAVMDTEVPSSALTLTP